MAESFSTNTILKTSQPQIPGVTPQIRQNMTSTHPLASNGVGQQITTST